MRTLLPIVTLACLFASPLHAQTWTVEDPVLRRIWELGMDESEAYPLAQALMDSLGPRLTGTPGMMRANEWAVDLLEGWGIDARNEQYGSWIGWDRGITHIDLIEPRIRTLEGTMLAWSAGTEGPVEGEVVIVPGFSDAAELDRWLPTVRGKFVAISFPQPTCRPDSHYEEYGAPDALQRLLDSRTAALEAFQSRLPPPVALRAQLEAAGVAGVLESNWAGEPGVSRVYYTNLGNTPSFDLSCEDYGLLWRLAENGQGPVIRVDAEATQLGEAPVHNTIGTIRGSELPNEYVMLSAHFDSWDGASGATDNGTGSIVMLEAMRILREAYPNPRRTVVMALWGGEEQGLNGSRRFVGMHPEIVENLQALFNQDEGTGRVFNITTQGLVDAGEHLTGWLAKVPVEITQHITADVPGLPSAGASDHASFICMGAPAINFKSVSWRYPELTWHSNRDTFDKVVFEEIRNNAVLTAMLVYLASEDPERIERTRRVMPSGPDGQPQPWPTCSPGQ